MNTMEYKGFIGSVSFDSEADTFFGKVINLPKDGITFEGASVQELKKAFYESVEDYLAWCKQEGKEPEKPYSGRFVVRLPPALHAEAVNEATKEGISLNTFIKKALKDKLTT